jgi:hypothetical protein
VQNTRTTGQKRPRDEQGGMELARDIAEIFCAAAVDPRSTALPVAKLQFIEKHVSALVRDGRYQATASDSTDTYTLPDAVRGAKADEAVKILDGLQKLVGSFRGSFPSLPPPSPPSPEGHLVVVFSGYQVGSAACLWWRGPVVGNRRVTNRIRTKGLRSVCFMLHFLMSLARVVFAQALCAFFACARSSSHEGAHGVPRKQLREPLAHPRGAPRAPGRPVSSP